MAGYPDKPLITYSYQGYQASLGDNSFPGTNLDADLARLVEYASETVDFLKLFANSDGSLKLAAIPDTANLADYTQAASDAASSAQLSQTNAAASASAASTSAGAAASSASSASSSAAAAVTTLSSSLLKASNLSDLANAATARTNLGLASFATKSSIVLADFSSNFFTADATGRGKFASGFVDFSMVPTGSVIQVVRTDSSAFATSAVVIPNDDTIPTSTEGAALAALNTTITPKSATNILLVDVVLNVNVNAVATVIAALFKDSETAARGASLVGLSSSYGGTILIRYQMVAGSTAATTFSVRYGPNTAATVTVNGVSAARTMGGTFISSLTVTEIKA